MPDKVFGLNENFDVERLAESKLGKVVAVFGAASGVLIKGVLRQYSRGDYAVLNPFVFRDKDNMPRIIERDSIIDGPVVVSEIDCTSLQEYVKKYEQVPKSEPAGRKR